MGDTLPLLGDVPSKKRSDVGVDMAALRASSEMPDLFVDEIAPAGQQWLCSAIVLSPIRLSELTSPASFECFTSNDPAGGVVVCGAPTEELLDEFAAPIRHVTTVLDRLRSTQSLGMIVDIAQHRCLIRMQRQAAHPALPFILSPRPVGLHALAITVELDDLAYGETPGFVEYRAYLAELERIGAFQFPLANNASFCGLQAAAATIMVGANDAFPVYIDGDDDSAAVLELTRQGDTNARRLSAVLHTRTAIECPLSGDELWLRSRWTEGTIEKVSNRRICQVR